MVQWSKASLHSHEFRSQYPLWSQAYLSPRVGERLEDLQGLAAFLGDILPQRSKAELLEEDI